MDNLAKQLRDARIRHQNGDNKSRFAQELGVSRHTITQIETSPELVTFGTLQKYCKEVGLSINLSPIEGDKTEI